MAGKRIDRVRKSDGREEPYDEAKLADSILRAARVAGRENRPLATDLAGVVTTYLERYHDRATPTSGEIRRMVEKILLETGHAEIARAFMQQDGVPSSAPAAAPPSELFPTDLFLVDGATRDEVSSWARERITAALVKEAAVDEAVARDIASAVEQRIFRANERRVSSTLIRELVNQELLTRGYSGKLRKQLVVGLPKYDLERLIRPDDTPPDPDRLCRTIGETTMKQYALQELYPSEAADAHLEGRIHIHDLEYPQKLLWHAPRLEPSAGSARALSAELASHARELRRAVRSVEFAHLNALYAGRAGEADEAPFVLSELAPCWVGVDLGDERSDRFAFELIRAWRDTATATPEFFVDDAALRDDGVLREACRLAADRGRTLFVFKRGSALPRSRFAAADGETIAGAVTLNLAQAFYRCEAGGDYYAELDHVLGAAVRALLAKRQLVRRVTPAPENHAYAVGVAGLDEAAQLLTGHAPAADGGALRMALRILSYLFFRVKEESEKHAIRLALHDVAGPEAAGRLLRVDSQMFARARGLAAQAGGEYTVGGRLRAAEGRAPSEQVALEARFHTLLPNAAAAIPAAVRKSIPPSELLSIVRRAHADTLAAQLWIA